MPSNRGTYMEYLQIGWPMEKANLKNYLKGFKTLYKTNKTCLQ